MSTCSKSETIVRRWSIRALEYWAKRSGLTVKWDGPYIKGYDKEKKEWVTLYNGLI